MAQSGVPAASFGNMEAVAMVSSSIDCDGEIYGESL
jgi:hypothetical protein